MEVRDPENGARDALALNMFMPVPCSGGLNNQACFVLGIKVSEQLLL